MKDSSAPPLSPVKALVRLLACAALLALSAASASAQSPTDGSTPTGLQPGSPSGSYALSDFDTVNLYNGSLNFRLPLLKVGGRGAAGYPVTLHVEKKWTVHKHFEPGVGNFYYADGGWWSEEAEGWRLFDAGKVDIRSARREQPAGFPVETLTRITFTAPDGTEYELRDQATNGQPVAPQAGGFNRGRVFVTSDGTSATFLSDWDILDDPTLGEGFYDDRPDGYLLLKDGTRFRVTDGKIAWMRDRNGNKVTFTYDTLRRVTSVTDSLNRQVTIVYATSSVPYTEIGFAGFGGAARTIRIGQTNLGSALRAGQTLKTIGQLFPELHGGGPAAPTVVSYVELPDGRRYQFRYNSYAELARVELPTGGAVEYDHAAGLTDGAASGVFSVLSGTGAITEKHVYRRVVERRVYPGGGSGAAYESRTTYSRPETTAANAGHVVSDSYDPAGALLARSRHYFYGSPRASFSQKPTQYAAYKDGREHKTEQFASDGTTVLRRMTQAFAQRAAVGWWSGDAELAPPNDPRLVETATTLADANLVSKQTFAYDQYNNQTDAYDYDFGAGAAGALLRRSHTDYVTAAAYVGADADPAVGAHLRALPSQTWVSSDAAGNAKLSRTTYEYDTYTSDARHAPLAARAGITGHDSAVYSMAFTRRGNVTGLTSYANAAAQTGGVTASTQYDVAGNEVKTIDGDGGVSQAGYADSFSDSVNRNTYAFPTSTTSPIPDPTGVYGSTTALTTSTVYDFSTGQVRSTTDANGKTVSFEFNDALDRPTRANRPDGGWTSFFYDDHHPCGPSVRTDTLLDAAGRVTSDFQFFDPLGRAVRTFKSDPQDAGKPYLTVDTQYDAVGRPWRVSKQYRSSGCTSAVNPSDHWTETTFDALGRPTLVKSTADNAAVTTAYSGNQVTVTDQAGKQRRRVTDALGRLTRVVEDPTGLAYATDYAYDALGNLRKVTQGTQLRFFMYDSLGRLTRARNPEQAVNAAITGTDSVTGNAQWSFAYAYDANGNLTTRTDPRNVTTTYTYDQLDRNTYVSYSDSTPHVKRAYDTATNGRGLLRASWTLTATGTHITQSAVDSYDAVGRPLVRRQYFYTNNVAGPAFSTQRTYDRAGHVLTRTYPSGRTATYTYDAAGRLATFAGNLGDGVQRTYASEVRYHELGSVEQERYGTQTPVYNKRFYNVRGQLAEIRVSTQNILAADPGHWNRGAILNVYSAQAGWTESREDNNGNLRKQMVFVPNDDAISGWWETAFFYDYDALDRLLQSREVRGGQNQWVQAFTYDRWGNRTINAANTTNAPEPQYTASAATNRLAPPAGYTMAYDAAGNLTTDTYTGEGTRAYDAEGRMTSAQFVSGQLQTAAYTYDADGKRVKRNLGAGGEVWQVYGLDGELLAEYAAGAQPAAPLKEYGHRGGEPLVAAEPGAVVKWLVTDHLGTPRIVMDSTGSLAGVSRHDYFAFGEEIGVGVGGRATNQGYGRPSGIRKRWAKLERDDETGLDYAQARYYSPAMGRFTSPDEFTGGPEELYYFADEAADNPTFYADIENPQSLNKYQYAYNNSLRYTDPTGHCPECAVEVLKWVVRTPSIPVPAKTIVIVTLAPVIAIGSIPGDNTHGDGSCPSCDVYIRNAQRRLEQQEAERQNLRNQDNSGNQDNGQQNNPPPNSDAANQGQRQDNQRPGRRQKQKKERTLEGAQNQLEGITKAQEAERKGRRRRPIDSTRKSEQNLDNELKKVKSLKDAEDPDNR